MDIISRLCSWYESQWIADVHEDVGISVSSLDNPGWSFSVDIANSTVSGREFPEIIIERSDNDWIHARIREERFEAFGGPNNLTEMIQCFLNWAEVN